MSSDLKIDESLWNAGGCDEVTRRSLLIGTAGLAASVLTIAAMADSRAAASNVSNDAQSMLPINVAEAAATDNPAIKHITAAGVTKPLPIFSHATVYNGTVYVSCIEGFIPGALELVSEAPGDQARQVFRNLKVILEAAGSSMSLVLKIMIFMTDMRHFQEINDAVNEAFPVLPPARSSIAVSELPGVSKVVVEAIAALRDG